LADGALVLNIGALDGQWIGALPTIASGSPMAASTRCAMPLSANCWSAALRHRFVVAAGTSNSSCWSPREFMRQRKLDP
jgi:hypothetical protein